MAYGEASPKNNSDEMMALASVLVRQRDARGYSDIQTFAKKERTFSYVVSDGNVRYRTMMRASDEDIARNAGMQAAVAAARNALNYGPDKSNGAYFWDGADIKSNYANHAKVKRGVRFTDLSHNIYGIKESIKLVIQYQYTKKKNKKTGDVVVEQKEIARYDHLYESTAGVGGTIFWKFGQDYMNATHAKPYK
ncbi:hypothetical protein ISN74_04740 [Dyella caseinilytica]|uniref:Uncharacterized protein n=2 Tax=Dyella caseinilytica TaxID=1849581 RepID=A0ABX7H1M8_9GAMM|nr:hypothetical protein ISN74_04740 [Dyella caseinilytica]